MRTISLGQLIGGNLTRNPVRSLSIVTLLGLVFFLVVSTGSNKMICGVIPELIPVEQVAYSILQKVQSRF